MGNQLRAGEACSGNWVALKEREKGGAVGRKTGGKRERKGDGNDCFREGRFLCCGQAMSSCYFLLQF